MKINRPHPAEWVHSNKFTDRRSSSDEILSQQLISQSGDAILMGIIKEEEKPQ
jgi:hypothetical protein